MRAHAQPGKLNYASCALGSSAHLSTDDFSALGKASIVHVPAKGIADGILAPAGAMRGHVARLNAIITKVVSTPQMKEGFNNQGLEPATMTPEAFAGFIRQEIAQNVRVVKAAKNRIE